MNRLYGLLQVEEMRTQMEASERARKQAENDAHEANDRVGELSAQNASLNAMKRKLETDIEVVISQKG